MSTERCELTELLVDQCAHCRKIPDLDAPQPPSEMSPASRAKALALHIEELMLIMNTNDLKRRTCAGGSQYGLRHFDGAEPFSLVGVTHSDDPDAAYFNDCTPWDLSAPLDVTVVSHVTRGDQELFPEDYLVRRYRRVKRPFLPIRPLKRNIVEVSHLAINSRRGTATTSAQFWGSNDPSDPWLDLHPLGYRTVGDMSPDAQYREQFMMRLAVGMQITRDYQWRVHLKYSGAEIGVTIPTTPGGIRSLFRLRDYEPGESRRKALTHWVVGHSRRIRKDTSKEDLIWVRDHLRGAMTFKWQDMSGAVHPSAFDLRRLAEMRDAAPRSPRRQNRVQP